MRILRARVRNYRVHADTEVAFHRQLTVVHGPNESGKSTLVEAMHRALFLSHKVGGQVRDAMLRQPTGGHPEVEVDFEREGAVWSLWKRFGGRSGGDVSLKTPEGKVLTGAEAEDRLAQLVGMNPVTSGGGAARALQERWGHLWVWQGTAGENLLSLPAGPDVYEHGKLVARLQEVGEVSVQSALDQEVVTGIEARWSKVFTPGGQVRAGSPLKKALADQASAQVERDGIQARLKEQEEAQRLHLEATRRLDETEAELPHEETRLRELKARLEQARELKRNLDQELTLLEPKRGELKRLTDDAAAIQAAQATLTQLAGDLGPGQQKLAGLQARQHEVLSRRTELREEKQKQDETLRGFRERVQAGMNRSHQARLTLQVHELERAAEVQEKLRRALATLDERLASLPVMGETDIQGLRERVQARDLAQAELRSLAAGVRAVRAGSRVEVDGAELLEGELRQITDQARLTVGDSVELELIPGGGGSTQEVRDRVEEAENRLAREQERLGVEGVDEALEILAKHQAIARERTDLVARSAPNTGNTGSGMWESSGDPAQELTEASEALRHLEGDAHLEPLAEVDPALVARLAGEEMDLQAQLKETQAELSRIQGALDAAQTALDDLGSEIQEASGALQAQETERASAENRVQMILEKHGSGDALQAAVKAVGAEVEAREKAIAHKGQELAGFDVDALEGERTRTQARISQLTETREQVAAERNRLEGALATGAGLDLDGELEQQEVELESLSAEVDRLEREAEMLQLLKDLLEEEQNRLATQFSAPLQRGMEAYLRCIVQEASTSAINYEAGQGFHDLRWRRGDGVAWEFDALSGGAREQLMAALRLAMAEVLAGVDDGGGAKSGEVGGGADRPGLPVVFDDSFVNADPRRMEGVNRMLQRAADRGLQVLVFTCDPVGVEALGKERMVGLEGRVG
ncbi:MAG: SMC family ATPase [Gemmatimonadota bacterium]